jgi:hypothetical protein
MMDTIESLNKHIIEMKAMVSRNDVPSQIKDMYKSKIIIYEAKKSFLNVFGE